MILPAINGQLGWDDERKQVQYILSWDDNNLPSDRVTSMYGTIEVISEGRAGNVVVQAELVTANSTATIQHPNGKFSVEIPQEATTGKQDLYFALSSGYNIDPPNGKVFVAGGVAYNTTALKLGDKVEVSELTPHIIMRFNYSTDMDASTLEICQLDPDENWTPVDATKVNIADGVATLTTSQLGAYALMMRGSDYPLFEAVKAMEEATEALKMQHLITHGGGNDAEPAYSAA